MLTVTSPMRKRAQRDRDSGAALYAAVQRASPDGILLVDAQQRIISYNQRFVEIWRVPPQALAGHADAPVLEAVIAQVKDREGFVARVKGVYADTAADSREEIGLIDGRTLDRYSAPVRLDDGGYLGRIWFFRDISENKRAADTAREDAGQFRALVEQQVAGIFVIGADGTLVYINAGFSTLLGYSPAEVIGAPFLDVVADEGKEAVRSAFAEHLRGGPLARQTITALKRKDGALVDVAAHASLATYHGAAALIGVVVDITQGKRAADLLRASEERFRLLIEQAPDAIVLYDVDLDRFVSANACAAALFGCSREELLKHGPLHFFLPDAADESVSHGVEQHNTQALAGLPTVFERRFRNALGREGTCEVSLVRLPTAEGRLLRASLTDVTESRQAAIALGYRDRVLHAVNLSVTGLVTAPSLAAQMPKALQMVAQALNAERIVVLERSPLPARDISVSMSYVWQASDVPQLGAAVLSSIAPDSADLAAWLAPLMEGKPVITDAATAPGPVGALMRELHNQSSLLMPISVAGKYWGHIGIDDCKAVRHWTPVELDTLATLSQVIGALIMREQSQHSLQNSEERFRAVSDTAQDAIVMIDSAAKVLYWNRAAELMFGYGAAEAMGKSVHQWLAPPRFHEKSSAGMSKFAATGAGDILGKTVEMAAIRKDGVEFPIELSVASMRLGVDWHAAATIRDLTERKRAADQIRYTAIHDDLTGLDNRAVFVETLQRSIERVQRDGESFAVLYLDLDHFKDINDTLGHPVGDLLLKSLAQRLRAGIAGADTLARFGGDEFALIQSISPQPIDAALLADSLLKAVNQPFTIQGNELRSGASVGIAVYGLDSPNAETLLAHAEVALYRAKAEGRGTYRFFTETMDAEVRTRVALVKDLREAMTAGQISLAYQPQVDADTGCLIGVEALARWCHPTRGMVPPGVFIPIAEQNGLIIELGTWVLREACRQMKEWLDAGIAPPVMAVNVSGLQFTTPLALERELTAILTETPVPPQRLELELTESALMKVSLAHNDALMRLRKLGFRIAIDDFGTGYSSLEYLGRFPVDRIKIAESFILALTSTSGTAVIVKAAIGLAHELKLDVVVEGVENAEQLKLVRSWGCRKVQGFYFSKPLPAGELSAVLRAGKIVPRAQPGTGHDQK